MFPSNILNVVRNLAAFLFGMIFIADCPSWGADWPMWRYDAARSAASPHSLPERLQLHWSLALPPLEPAWEEPVNRDRMPYDRAYEPIVLDKTLFFASSRSDRLTALSVTDGSERWRYYAEGPVRLPPVAADGKVYFAADDGMLVCLDAQEGKLLWERRGGPTARKVLGNGRFISIWPVRGGPVISEGRIYFGAGIWPFEGCFLFCVDANTGQTVWENAEFASEFQAQPHGGSYSFAGVAPQGALALVGERLIVPGGRSTPAGFNRNTGRLEYFHFQGSPGIGGFKVSGKLEGGSHVAGSGDFYLNHRGINTVLYQTEKGHACRIWRRTTYPVLDGGIVYLSGKTLEAYRLEDFREKPADAKPLWEMEIDASGALIKAGNRLYAAGKSKIIALELQSEGPPSVAREIPVEGTVVRLLAAAERLFAVTLEGSILAFGAEETEPVALRDGATAPTQTAPADDVVETLLSRAALSKGYCLVPAVQDASVAKMIAGNSGLRVLLLEPESVRAEALRRDLDEAGLYGARGAVLRGTPSGLELPPYAFALAVCEAAPDWSEFEREITAVYQSLRPYGGTLCIPAAEESDAASLVERLNALALPRAEVATDEGWVFLTRNGPLEGAGTWTHQYGDITNTVKSDDTRVRLPLGLLWFGGNSHIDTLPRHGHGPPEQVLGGRLFIQGTDSLSARDVYTGATLWKRIFEDLGTEGIYYDSTYRSDPLDTTYNQVHIAGANARGTNFVVTPEGVHIVMQDRCEMLDPATGQTLRTFRLPSHEDAEDSSRPTWGFVGVYEDILLAGSSVMKFSTQFGIKPTVWENFDHASSKRLVAMNRHDGRILWIKEANHAFRHNTIIAGGGKVFCVDRLPDPILAQLSRRGEAVDAKPVLSALDAWTGETLWENTDAAFGTFLSYSDKHDLVVQGGRPSRDMVAGEPDKRLNTIRGADGSVLWDKEITYGGPCILHGETLYTNAVRADGAAIHLLTGEPVRFEHPLTGELIPWTYHRTYGCNTVIAAENLLTFRSGAAGFCDPRTGGTGNFGGFKSGCTPNLVAADGVLNAPDYTRTCTCSYQNQTSLALVPRDDLDYWTYHRFPLYVGNPTPIRRLGLNFGAPGDRFDGETLWLDYPSVGGSSPDPEVTVEGDIRYVRRDSRRMEPNSGSPPWLSASWAEGIRSIAIRLVPEEWTETAPDKPDEGAPPGSDRPRRLLYTVALHFVEPDPQKRLGQRRVNVSLQGERVLEDFDVLKQAAQPNRGIVRVFQGIAVEDVLRVEIEAVAGEPVLCGIGIARETR